MTFVVLEVTTPAITSIFIVDDTTDVSEFVIEQGGAVDGAETTIVGLSLIHISEPTRPY